MSSGTETLTDALDRLDEHALEELCYELIAYEVAQRHVDPELDGPSPGKHADGGRDIRLEIRHPPRHPRQGFQPALTHDEGESWYSCKSGGTWQKGVRRDAGPTRRTLERRALDKGWQSPETASPAELASLAKDKEIPARGLLDMLARGGRYILCTNRRARTKKELRIEVAGRLRFWIEACLDRSAPEDLDDRIIIEDANDLAKFIRLHGPAIDPALLDKLKMREPTGLVSWAQWTADFDADRRMLGFQPDSQREALIHRIAELVSGAGESPVIRLIGAPGVGKTRLVHEALVRALGPTDTRRVRYTSNPNQARDAIEDDFCRRCQDLVLVVDELPPEEGPPLARRFLSRAQGTNARLIAIGPLPAERSRPSAEPWQPAILAPLEASATRALIAHELDMPAQGASPLVEQVLALSSGYPLFAALLAQALAQSPDALDDPDVEAEWAAARAVLAGSKSDHGGDAGGWNREADLRAKALLVVLMAPLLDWDEIDEPVQERLGRAVDASWRDIRRAARDCHARGLLRFAEGTARRYVSPYNLARIIVNRFFHGGPDDLGRGLRKHAPEHREALYRAAERLSAARAVLDALARGELDDLERSLVESSPSAAFVRRATEAEPSTSPEAPARGDIAPFVFDFVARRLPEHAARVLARLAEPDAMAGAPNLGYALLGAYEHLTRRRISRRAFAAVEAALFHLALRAPAIWNAKEVWCALFQPVLHLTHQSFEDRFRILHRRCMQGATEERSLALEALCAITGTGFQLQASLGYSEEDLQDGAWEDLEGQALAGAITRAWALLAEMVDDTDPAVAHRARTLVSAGGVDSLCWLAGSARWEPVERIVSASVRWTAEDRHALLAWLEAGRQVLLDRGETEQAAALAALAAWLAPASFQERLLAQVGSLPPGTWPLDDARRAEREQEGDAALAAEGLSPPYPLLDEIDWLEGETAVRAGTFAVQLGLADEHGRLLEVLLARARAGLSSRLLPPYLLGWSERAGEDAVDAWIAAHLDEPPLHPLLARTIASLGGSERRLAWLRTMLDAGSLDPFDMPRLAPGKWAGRVDTTALCDFIRRLAARGQRGGIVALSMGDELARHHRDGMPAELEVLLGALLRATAPLDLNAAALVAWERIALRLLADDQVAPVLDAVVVFMASDARPGLGRHVSRAIQGLVRQGQGDALWRALAPLLLETRSAVFKMRRAGLLAAVSPAAVLDWVGDDVERGAKVAALCMPYADRLDEVCRQLLIRFGARSEPAEVLMARALTTPHAVSRLETHFRQQLASARQWQADDAPAVARWAEALGQRLLETIAAEEAREELARLYG